jgi:four helix bundle protein
MTVSSDIQNFRDLDAWKVAMDLSVLAYALCKRLPASQRFELSAQIRRSAVSIPANVAEGQSYGKTGRYVAHVRIAQGSLGELETHFELARRFGFLSEAELIPAERLLTRTGQLLHGLRRSLSRKRAAQIGNGLTLLAGLLFLHRFLAIVG